MKSPSKPEPKVATVPGKSNFLRWRAANVALCCKIAFITAISIYWQASIQAAETPEPNPFPKAQAHLPEGFPTPAIPEDNPITLAKVALGRALFYEGRLAVDGKTSCGNCHIQALAFTDGLGQAMGATGLKHPRGAMSLVNVAFNASMTWADPEIASLETQAMVPLFNQHPIEMGLAGREKEVLSFLREDPNYQAMFKAAFPASPKPTIELVTKALANFERTIVSFNSPVDAIVMNDAQVPQRDAILRGMRLFFSDRLNCGKCHGGFNFSGPVKTGDGKRNPTFHHNGLQGQGPTIDERQLDPGLAAHTGSPWDWGKFRAPTLRNIAVTAPYMHRGQLRTLDEVIDHYAAGGQKGPAPGSGGRDHPNKSPLIKGFQISSAEREDLLTFLRNLTDESLLKRKDLAAP